MNEIDKIRWKKVERLADKTAYILEAVIRWRAEEIRLGHENADSREMLSTIQCILYDVGGHDDTKEAQQLFKEIMNTRIDRALSK